MRRLRGLPGVVVGGALGIVLAGVLAGGCSSSGGGGPEDEGGPSEDATDTGSDAPNEAGGPDTARPETGADANPPDAQGDVAQVDARADAEADAGDGAGGREAGDAGADAGEAGDGAVASDAEPGAESGGMCTTTIGLLLSEGAGDGGTGPEADASDASDASDAGAASVDAAREAGREGGAEAGADGATADGAADAGSRPDANDGAADAVASDAATDAAELLPPELLYGFDNGSNLGWNSNPVSGATISLGATVADGHACLGALQLYTTYSAFGANPLTQFVYGGNGAGSMNWTGRTRLHAWLKVTTSDYVSLSGARAFVYSNNYGLFPGPLVAAATLADGLWHETTVDLTPPAPGSGSTFDPALINGLGAQIMNRTTATAGGPTAPAATTLLVDDIWLE